ncbi:hypothetical protein EDD22DRAFT_849085 [Suillus occidentalis]|nr:hypothetical protein EDD22DRAFT_849085 [Suillus occidentalis]
MSAPPPRVRGIMMALHTIRPRCNYCKEMRYICVGRSGEVCIPCQEVAGFEEEEMQSYQSGRLDDLDPRYISTTAVPGSTGFGYSLHQEQLSAVGRTVIQQRMSKTEWVHYNFLMLMELAYHSDGKDSKELAMDFDAMEVVQHDRDTQGEDGS